MRSPGFLGEGAVLLMGCVAAVYPDQFEPVEPLAYPVQDQGRAVAVLDAGEMDDDPQDKHCPDPTFS